MEGDPRAVEMHTEDPFRVEIKQNAKGEPQVSVRATAKTYEEAVNIAVKMYKNTLDAL